MDVNQGLRWRQNFTFMALAFATCQAMVVTPVGFATSLLGPGVGEVGTGLLMLFSMFSSLLVGAPVVSHLGPKASLVLAMSLSTLYATLFAIATLVGAGSTLQWIVYVAGAITSGCGSGILWTAQGVFFAGTSASVAAAECKRSEDVTAELGGRFASILLAVEVSVKLSASILQGSFLQFRFSDPLLSLSSMFLFFASLAFCMVMVMAVVVKPFDVQSMSDAASPPISTSDKLKAAIVLWKQPQLWLLGMTNLTFGFSAGYMNGFVNGSYAKASATFGAGGLGTLLAMTCIVASMSSVLFGWLAQRVGKGPLVLLGSLSFGSIALTTLLFPPSSQNGYWGMWLIALYVLQGLGRANFESTNKAIFADFFPGPQSAGAFANCMMQNTFAFFVSFLLQSRVHNALPLAMLVIVPAALCWPGFALASTLKRHKSPVVEGGSEGLLRKPQ